MNTKRLLKGKGIGFVVIIVLIIIIAIIYWWPKCTPDGCNSVCPADCKVAQDPDCGCRDNNGCCGLECTFQNDNDCPPDELQVHFIDVGQGDSILIDLGSKEVLIDGGKKSPGVTDYIREYIDGPLEVMVATHPHADHIGGLIKVLEVFQVEEIWLNGDTSTSKTYQDFMAAVSTEGAEVNRTKRNSTISTEDLNFSILNPPDTLFPNETNNNSIVLRLEYGDIAFLFTGDGEKEAEANILTTGSELRAQILKAGHHCSRTSSSRPFLEKVKSEKAICMVGRNNRYGHPHQETLTALKEIGAEIYRTDTDGTIIVLTNGIDYKIKTSK